MRRLVLVSLAVALAGCPAAVKGSCIAIQAADEVCAMIAVPNPDGGAPTMVKVSGPELRAFASERAAAHEAAK